MRLSSNILFLPLFLSRYGYLAAIHVKLFQILNLDIVF